MRVVTMLWALGFLVPGPCPAQTAAPAGSAWMHRTLKTCAPLQGTPPGLPEELARLDASRLRFLSQVPGMRLEAALERRLLDLGEIDLQQALVEYATAVATGCRVFPNPAMDASELSRVERDTLRAIAEIAGAENRHTICHGTQEDRGRLYQIIQTRLNSLISDAQQAEAAISRTALERGSATRSVLGALPEQESAPAGQARGFLTRAERAQIRGMLRSFFGEENALQTLQPISGAVYHHPGNPLFGFQKLLEAWKRRVRESFLTTGNHELLTEDARAALCASLPAAPQLLGPPRPAQRPKR